MTQLTDSIRVKKQERIYGPRKTEYGQYITATVRYDDRCGNGYNTLSITGQIGDMTFGCIHDEIAKYFPELVPVIPWHLVSSDGPMHYIANTVYHAKAGGLKYAQAAAVWPDGTLEQLQDVCILKTRLPNLLREFRKVVEDLGFTY